MAIQYNENIKIAAPAPLDKRYLSNRLINGVYLPYSSTTEVNTTIIPSERYIGLTVNISGSEYWYKNGIGDSDLIEKIGVGGSSSGVDSVFNLGFFLGNSGVQILPINHLTNDAYDGNYESLYNYYYRDVNGYIRIGSSNVDNVFRRGYYNKIKDKSFIWNDYIQSSNLRGWIFIDGNVDNLVGTFQYGVTYYTGISPSLPYSNDEWLSGQPYINGSYVTIDSVSGSLNTGNTISVGGTIFRDIQNTTINLRTIKSKTPDFIDISYDDYFVYISGATPVLGASSIGAGAEIYAGSNNNILKFKSLIGSGDTNIIEYNDRIVIHSSSPEGSGLSLTGVTNIGAGIPIYKNIENRNAQLRTILGSGNTSVSLSGDTILINSLGSDGIFTQDIIVSIANGKTFGKYCNGDIIPASGKSAIDVIKMALSEALPPLLNLYVNNSNLEFGRIDKFVDLSFSYEIKTLGATISCAKLEYCRVGDPNWTTLTNSTITPSIYNHSINDSANRFNSNALHYRYCVIDSAGSSGMTTIVVNPQAYQQPNISTNYSGTLQSYETLFEREKGNVITNINGTISSNRSLVNLTGYKIQRCVDNGAFVDLVVCNDLNSISHTIQSYIDNTAPVNANNIGYRIVVSDEYTTSNGDICTIDLKFASYYGYNANTVLSNSDILNLGNQALLSTRTRAMLLTAPDNQYTYIVYPQSFGQLTNAIMDGAAPVLGGFSCCLNNIVTNQYGQSETYIIYKSNAPKAFTNNCLEFS